MRKSLIQPVRQPESRVTKNALSRGSAETKSSSSKNSEKVLSVATPTSERLRFLKELELVVPSGVPADERSVPLDLTGESSRTVGSIHSEFTARLAYILFQRSQVEASLIEYKRALKLAKAEYLIKGADHKKYELDAQAALDPEIRKLEDKIAAYETMAVILDGVIDGYVKIVEGTSREMSRRGYEKTSRGD